MPKNILDAISAQLKLIVLYVFIYLKINWKNPFNSALKYIILQQFGGNSTIPDKIIIGQKSLSSRFTVHEISHDGAMTESVGRQPLDLIV